MDDYVKISSICEIFKRITAERAWGQTVSEHWRLRSLDAKAEMYQKAVNSADFVDEINKEISVVAGFVTDAQRSGKWVDLYVSPTTFQAQLPTEIGEGFSPIWRGKYAVVARNVDSHFNWLVIYMKYVPAEWYDEVPL